MRPFYKITILLLLAFLSFAECFCQTDALGTGNCFKIGVTQNGVYKLDAAFFKKYGIDLAQTNPKNIHLFGNGSGMLPQANAAKRPAGLTENAIIVKGEEDGKFDGTDYLLFYGQGPHKVSYNAESKTFSHQLHLYSDTCFYFLVINNLPGLRIKKLANQVNKQSQTVNSFDDYQYHENETKSILGKSGREWFGEEFSSNAGYDRTYDLKISGILSNSKAIITTGLVGTTINDKTQFKVSMNGKLNQEIEMPGVYDYFYGQKGVYLKTKSDFIFENATDQKLIISCNKNSGNNGWGYLDFFGIQIKRELTLFGSQTAFRSIESTQNDFTTFSIKTKESQINLWDITNPLIPQIQDFIQNDNLTFTTNTKNELKEYIVFNEQGFLLPPTIKKIENQNLHQISTPNFLIVTTEKFHSAAQLLADHRNTNDHLTSLVVDVQQIYNEFSSGMTDVTAIRDFTKYLYDQPNSKLKYLLIFADANFDIRNKSKEKLNADFIPSYQSRESLDNVKSFSSEDYYGFMDNNVGDWFESDSNSDNHLLNIGVGRIPVKTTEEAEGVVHKLIQYDNQKNTLGLWRTKIALIADDGDYNLHQHDTEDIGDIINSKGVNFHAQKIYVDAAPRLSGNGKLSPETSKKIEKVFKKGALIFNYVGHGGPSNLSDEKILTREDLGIWQNFDNMPLMVTATCEFGRYDDPGQISGAEYAVLNPTGGAIGLLTTTRPVYSISNKKINEAFYKSVFEPVNGETPRLGEIVKYTKNNSFEYVYNRNFTLLGDPSMKLAFPKHKIVLTKINGKNISQKPDTLKALSKIILEGEIKDYKDDFNLSDFNGKLFIKVFDKESVLRTLGNNINVQMDYKVFQDKIFDGITAVKNGKFTVSFVVPKDIQYQFGKSRIELYAETDDQSKDASGVNNNIIIGGSANTLNADNVEPTLNAYLDKPGQTNAIKVSKNPTLYANIFDENGININPSAAGHEIVGILDGTTQITLNEYYEPVFDNANQGNLKYQLENLKTGKHNLTITVWDTYNNSTTSTLDFEVIETDRKILKNVFNFPNPVSNYTTIQFDHDFVGESFNANISIFDFSGKFIMKFNSPIQNAESPATVKISTQNFGKNYNLLKGIYPYSVEITNGSQKEIACGMGKLIVID